MTLMLASAEQWPALSRLLDEALALPPEQRDAWLSELAGEDAEHRDTLGELLATQAGIETGDFMQALPALAVDAPADELTAGATVGPYRLIELLGHGGMGVVWRAERADGTVKRAVALKLPRVVWGGSFAERLAREREILAGLEHEHIARLYDAGLDAQGRPYLAMELVDGEPIDAYCRAQEIPLRERVALLLQVMAAVAHAHARLIVHRDLKPANILVRGDGRVRLLDFGVAKLLEGDRTRATALTELSGRALTLEYASPEQIRGEPLSTGSDVYSMAVVAYEVLTGARPYRLKRGSAAELEEAIASAEVPPASVAAEDRVLRHRLRGDVDAILNKALKKQPADRYATMDAFAQDLQRWRDGLPVQAQPDRLGYRAAKFIGRYRLQVAAGVVVTLALLTGTAVALWQAKEARLQAQRAQTEAATAKAVQGFLESVFSANTGDQADPRKARDTTARDLLDRGAERIDAELATAPMARLRLLATLASMYEDMAETGKQLALQQKRLTLARSITGATSDETVLAMADMAHALTTLERREESAAILKQGAAILDARHDDSSQARFRIEKTQASLDRRMDPEHGLVAAGRALQIARRQGPSADLVLALQLQGDNAYYSGHNDVARAAFAEAISLVEANPQYGANMLSIMYGSLGNAQRELREYEPALSNLRKGLALERQRGALPANLHFTEMQLANFLYQSGRFRESLDAVAPAAQWARGSTAGLNATVAMLPAAQGRALVAYGHAAEGLAAIEQAQAMAARIGPAPELEVPLLSFQARALVDLGRLREARAALDRAIAIIRAQAGRMPPGHVEGPERRWLVASGRAQEALAAFQAARAERKLPAAPAPGESVGAQAESAWLELEAGHAAAAETQARKTLDSIAAGKLAEYQRDQEAGATLVLGRALLQQHQAFEALPLLARAVALHRAVYDPDRSPAVADAWLALAQARRALGDPRAAEADKEALRVRSAPPAH